MNRLLTLLLFLVCFTCRSEVLLNERFTHYMIAPVKVDQIKIELRNNSPVSRENKVFHGGTQWTLVPHFRWTKERNLCRIRDVQVQLNGVYTLPKLDYTQDVSTDTKTRFDAYYLALVEHEKGHQDLWISAGEKIDQLLKNFEPFYDCQQMANEAKNRIAKVIRDYQQLNRDYDSQTGHGRTQGAAIR